MRDVDPVAAITWAALFAICGAILSALLWLAQRLAVPLWPVVRDAGAIIGDAVSTDVARAVAIVFVASFMALVVVAATRER
jgi:hypothetical protein